MASFATLVIVALVGVVGSLAKDTAVEISPWNQRVTAICVGSSKLTSSDVLTVNSLFTDEVDMVFAGDERKLSREHQKSIICAKPDTYTYAGGKFTKSKLLAPWKRLAWQAEIASKAESVGSNSASVPFHLVNEFFNSFGASLPSGIFADILFEEHPESAKAASVVYLFCDGSAQKCYFSESSISSNTEGRSLRSAKPTKVKPQGCGYQFNPSCNCWIWICN